MRRSRRSAPRAAVVAAATLLGALSLAASSAAQSTGAAARTCPDVVFAANSEDAAFEVRTSRTSCATARKIIVAVRRDDALRPRGYSCRYRRDRDEAIPTTNYTCSKGKARVRWVYGGVGTPLSVRCASFRASSERITGVRAYKGVSCRRAREVIRRLYAGRAAPRGWNCSTAGTEGGCSRTPGARRPLLTWRAPDVES